MALSASDIVSGQVMIPIDFWQRPLFSQNSDYFLQQPHIITSPNNPLVVLLEGRLIPNCQHSDPPSGLLRRKKICSCQSHSLHPRLLSLLQHSALRRQSQKECDIHAPPSSQNINCGRHRHSHICAKCLKLHF